MAMPNTATFDNLLTKIVEPVLCDIHGFHRHEPASYAKEIDNKLRRIVAFDFRPGRKKLRVMVGVNSVIHDEGCGLHLLRFFTGGSLSEAAHDIPAPTAEVTERFLHRFLPQLDVLIFPWLNKIDSLAALADGLHDENLDYYRAQLYQADGRTMEAQRLAETYKLRLARLLKANMISRQDCDRGREMADALIASMD